MKRRTYVLWKKILTRVGIFAIIVGGFYVYFRTGAFTIHEYKIVGAPESYQEELERNMFLIGENRLYAIFPGNRVISYHDDEIRTLIMETLPNTSNISIRAGGLHTVIVRIKSHTALFSISDTHAISKDGTIYKEIVPVNDLPRLSIATSTAVSPTTLQSVAMLVQDIDTVLFPVRYIAIDEHNDVRLYDSDKSSFVVISGTADMKKVWSNIVSAVDTDPLKTKLTTSKEKLEYIDTRFGNKVFYKFTNTVTPAIIPPHDTTDLATTTVQ